MPAGSHDIRGVILADQVESLDWRARQATPLGHLPDATVAEVVGLIGRLLF